MTRLLPVFALVSLLLAAGSPARAASVLIPADLDNTLYEDPTGSLSNGIGDYVFAGRTGTGAVRRAVLRFPVAGSLPPDATILSAELRLTATMVTAGPRNVSVHRVLAAWGEGTSNAPGGEGGGAPATAGDATWLHGFYPGTPWAAPGGDFEPAASAVTAVDDVGPYAWASTPALVSDVQLWLDQPELNFGWLLRGDESTSSTAKRFDSRHYLDPATRPALEVVYELSVQASPSTWGRVKAGTR